MTARLIYAQDHEKSGRGRRNLALRTQAGELTRLRNGVYIPTADWAALDWWKQYKLHVEAAVGKGRARRVLIRKSAAIVWGLPTFGKDTEVQLLAGGGAHGRRRAGIRWHASPLLEPLAEVDGFWVTGRAQTVVDMAAHLPFEYAVAAMDQVLNADPYRNLPPLDRGYLRLLASALPTDTQTQRALKIINFADPRSGSPGESLSRAQLYLHHFPAPELQYPFYDHYGRLLGIADFYWKEERVVGEFDGSAKYSRDIYLNGDTPAAAMVREKTREDRIRALGVSFARWNWQAAIHPESHTAGLLLVLRDAGLKQDRWNGVWPGLTG